MAGERITRSIAEIGRARMSQRPNAEQAFGWIENNPESFLRVVHQFDHIVSTFNGLVPADIPESHINTRRAKELLGDTQLPTFREVMQQPGAVDSFYRNARILDLYMGNGENDGYYNTDITFHIDQQDPRLLVIGSLFYYFDIVNNDRLEPGYRFGERREYPLLARAMMETASTLTDTNPLWEAVSGIDQLSLVQTDRRFTPEFRIEAGGERTQNIVRHLETSAEQSNSFKSIDRALRKFHKIVDARDHKEPRNYFPRDVLATARAAFAEEVGDLMTELPDGIPQDEKWDNFQAAIDGLDRFLPFTAINQETGEEFQATTIQSHEELTEFDESIRRFDQETRTMYDHVRETILQNGLREIWADPHIDDMTKVALQLEVLNRNPDHQNSLDTVYRTFNGLQVLDRKLKNSPGEAVYIHHRNYQAAVYSDGHGLQIMHNTDGFPEVVVQVGANAAEAFADDHGRIQSRKKSDTLYLPDVTIDLFNPEIGGARVSVGDEEVSRAVSIANSPSHAARIGLIFEKIGMKRKVFVRKYWNSGSDARMVLDEMKVFE